MTNSLFETRQGLFKLSNFDSTYWIVIPELFSDIPAPPNVYLNDLPEQFANLLIERVNNFLSEKGFKTQVITYNYHQYIHHYLISTDFVYIEKLDLYLYSSARFNDHELSVEIFLEEYNKAKALATFKPFSL